MQYWVTDPHSTTLVEAESPEQAIIGFEYPAFAMPVSRRAVFSDKFTEMFLEVCRQKLMIESTADPFAWRAGLFLILSSAVQAHLQVSLGIEGSVQELKILEEINESLRSLSGLYNDLYHKQFPTKP